MNLTRAPQISTFLTPSGLALRCVGASAFLFALLQVWRPYFFLTDDNLVGTLPAIVALGRNVLQGQTPFEISQLYGGGFQLLRDPSGLCLWNPLVWALALLGQTRFYLAIIDIFVGVNLALTAFATAHLFALWRQRFALRLSDRRLMFLVLTWVFSVYVIIVNAAWFNFVANMAALPVMLLGLFDASRRRGLILTIFGFAQGFLVGHLSPFLFSLAFGAIFVLLWAQLHRDWEPLRRFVCGGALCLLLTAPLLGLAWSGFAQTARNAALLTTPETTSMSMSGAEFTLAWLGGVAGLIITQLVQLSNKGDLGGFVIVAFCAHIYAAIAVLWQLIKKMRSEQSQNNIAPEWLWGILTLFFGLLVLRPSWMQALVDHVPLYRSLRFSFREIWLLHFCIAAWLVWRIELLSTRTMNLTAFYGVVILGCSLLPFEPPTFSILSTDRAWALSGRPQKFWESVKTQLPPNARILPVIDAAVMKTSQAQVPFCLLGAYNYPALYDVPSSSGYVILGLESDGRRRAGIPGPSGMWTPREARARLKREPNLRLLHLRSLQPLVITLDDAHSSRRLNLPPAP